MKKKSVASIFNKPLRKARKESNVNWPLPDQLIGVEVEVEFLPGVREPENYREYWTNHRDGSLRNGTEYVLSSPMKGNMLSSAIAALFEGSVFQRSTTGSTHIHVDMTDESSTYEVVQVMTMLVYVLESAFFAAIDSGREWCGYTNRLMSAPESLIGRALNAKSENDYADLVNMCQDSRNIGRYYGCNLQALDKYGSIEFRYFPTATSQQELIEWTKLCMNIKKAAVEIGTTEALMEIMESPEAYDEFIGTYFKEWRDVFLVHMPQWQASSNFRKGMAASAAWRVANENKDDADFNPDSILKSKSLSKFVKKNADWKAPTLSIIFAPVEQLGSVPAITNRLATGTLLYHNELYVLGTSRSWEIPSTAIFSRFTSRVLRQLRTLIQEALNNNPLHAAERGGMSAREAERYPQNLYRALTRVNQTLSIMGEVGTLDSPEIPAPIPRRPARNTGQRIRLDENFTNPFDRMQEAAARAWDVAPVFTDNDSDNNF